jgi:hypothetical protein
MRRVALFALAVIALGGARPAPAEDEDGGPLAGLSGAEALVLVRELAADSMLGRKTGFQGGTLVENWIAQKMGEIGLDPLDSSGSYLEPFHFAATDLTGPIEVKVAGQALEYGKDFGELLYSGGGKVEGEVVFVGYGISRPDLGWDDYAGVDVKGKVVLAIRGAPKARAAEFPDERMMGWKSSTARDRGAVGAILAEGEKPIMGTLQERWLRPDLPSVSFSSAAADRLLAKKGTTLAKEKALRDEGKPGSSFATGVAAALSVSTRVVPEAEGRNAIGGIKGRDPDLRGEVVLVGAHMDHLGVDPLGRPYNGADDNASGTAVLLHVADVLKRNGWRPKRTVVFVGFGAGEQGLVGSRVLARDGLPFQNDGIACVLNMDMVGQGETNLTLAGGHGYPEMVDRLRGYLPEDLRKTVHAGRVEPNGDHWPFFERGVPAFFLATRGDHPNYHAVGDDAANVKPECLEAAARVVGALVVRLGAEETPLLDPMALHGYLLREGFRATRDVPKDAARLRRDGVGAVLFTHGLGRTPDADPRPELEKRVLAELPSSTLAWTAAEMAAANGRGELACVPMLQGVTDVLKPEHVRRLAGLGCRCVAPVGPLGASARTAWSDAQWAAFFDACREAHVIADLHDRWALERARPRLGNAPAFARRVGAIAELEGLRRALGPDTLFLLDDAPAVALPLALAAAEGLSPCVVVSSDTEGLKEALHEWDQAHHPNWREPDSEDRKNVRAALGGRLLEWFRRVP